MSGALSVPLSISGVLSSDPWVKTLLLVTGIACAVFAAYSVWAAERKRGAEIQLAFESLTERFQRLTKPNLLLNIEQILTGDRSDGGVMGVGAAINLFISNTGAPSVANNYTAWAMVGGKEIKGQLHAIAPQTKMGATSENSLTLNPKDAIYDKTASNPIQTGARVGGWMLAYFPSLPRDALRMPSNSIAVSVMDVYGEKYIGTIEMAVKPTKSFQYMPDGSGPPSYEMPKAT